MGFSTASLVAIGSYRQNVTAGSQWLPAADLHLAVLKKLIARDSLRSPGSLPASG